MGEMRHPEGKMTFKKKSEKKTHGYAQGKREEADLSMDPRDTLRALRPLLNLSLALSPRTFGISELAHYSPRCSHCCRHCYLFGLRDKFDYTVYTARGAVSLFFYVFFLFQFLSLLTVRAGPSITSGCLVAFNVCILGSPASCSVREVLEACRARNPSRTLADRSQGYARLGLRPARAAGRVEIVPTGHGLTAHTDLVLPRIARREKKKQMGCIYDPANLLNF